MEARASRTSETAPRSRAAGTSARASSGRATAGDGADRFRHSYSKDRAQLLRRLSRIEGQVRGIARMIERDEYCIDILQQTSALRAAIDSLGLLVMEDHVAGCLQTAARTGEAEAYTEELMDVVRRTLGRPVRGSRQTQSD
jgi:DNA-binding FrmR family transcriptional regulator